MDTGLALAPMLVLLLAFEVFCVIELVRHEPRLLPRWVWLVICLISVPLGGIIFLLVGRGERTGLTPSRRTGPADDRPAATVGPRSSGTRSHPPDTNRPPAVRTEGLGKDYDGHAALTAVDLVVPSGSVFGLVGPNGAGKTTLLGILSGLRHPTSGSVTFGVPPGSVAVLPDTPRFEPWLTAFEVIELARRLTTPDRDSARSVEVLDQVGLTDAADRRTGGFSRGMLQRLGLAATIVGEPELLLLDEPCSALDPLGRREMLDLVGRLGGRHTVLFCSHILDDVQEVCDRVGILRDGRLLFQGPLSELLVGDAAPAYTIRVRPPVAPVLAALERQPWVTNVEQVGAEELHLRSISIDEVERRLPATLAEAEARVISVVPAGADLERVFLELTAGAPK